MKEAPLSTVQIHCEVKFVIWVWPWPSRSINIGSTYSRWLLSGLLWLNVNDALQRAPQAQTEAA